MSTRKLIPPLYYTNKEDMDQTRCPSIQRALIAEQKEHSSYHTYNFTELIKSDSNFLNSIVTGDESWCFAHDLETKR